MIILAKDVATCVILNRDPDDPALKSSFHGGAFRFKEFLKAFIWVLLRHTGVLA